MDIVVSTNGTSTKSENVTTTVLKNSDDKKVRYKIIKWIVIFSKKFYYWSY